MKAIALAAGVDLRIGSDRSRWLAKVDPANRELALSIGAFLENLVVAAPPHGYLAEYSVTGGDAGDDERVQVSLKPAAPQPASLERLRARRTMRSGQQPRPLSSADAKSLVDHFDHRAHFFSPTSRKGRYLAKGTIEANRAQAFRDDAQEELAAWIRLPNSQARAHRDGLTQESMEIAGFAGWYVRHFMSRAAVLSQGFGEQGLDRIKQQMAACGGWIVVTSPDGSLPALIEAGRRTERMWLAVRDRFNRGPPHDPDVGRVAVSRTPCPGPRHHRLNPVSSTGWLCLPIPGGRESPQTCLSHP